LFEPAPAGAHEFEAAFRLIFQHLPLSEREARISNGLKLLRTGELDAGGIAVLRDKHGLAGAIVTAPIAGAGALVWPPQARSLVDAGRIEDQLLQYATRNLRKNGAKLAQTLLTAAELPLANSLLRNGFAHITRLWYLRHELRTAGRPKERPQLTYVSYDAETSDVFHQTLVRTYEGTRDCPEVNGVRTLDEIMAGHRAQGAHDPERWWLALQQGDPVGVLMLTAMPEWQGWDLSYLGVVPAARRSGVGRAMTQKALSEARRANAGQLTLAVDARNEPAWKMYRELGFEAFDEREVYLAIWNRPAGS
jgi:ribosomal protein S18 acetylase RimI-like enzyme